MTIEEAKLALQDNLGWLTYTLHRRISDAIKVAIEVFNQISRLSNLEEAADKYANEKFIDEPSVGQWGTGDYEAPVDYEYPREIAKDSFKAGAEWVLNQLKQEKL